MGTFRVEIGVGNPLGRDFTPVSALVNTGATHSMMPESLLAALQLHPLERKTFRTPDGSRIQYDVGEARFRIDGRERTNSVIFGPEGRYLLGAHTLRVFNLTVDSTAPNPRLVPEKDLHL